MNLIYDFCKKLKRQFININVIQAASFSDYLLHLIGASCSIFNADKASFPLNITLDLTYDCNLFCEFCFLNFLPNFRNENRVDYLSYDEISALVKSVKIKKTSFFLTGGEPLLRKDLFEIINEIKMHGFRCGLFTNATLLNYDINDKLIKSNLNYLLFSLDGPEKIHDTLRGVAGSFKKTYNNIASLISRRKKSKLKVIMNSLILDKNQSYLFEMIDIAKNLKVDCVAFDFLTFLTKNNLKAHQDNFTSLFPEDNFKSLVFVKDFKKADFNYLTERIDALKNYAKMKKVRIFFKPDLNKGELEGWFNSEFDFIRRCIYPLNVVRISPYGDIYPCAAFYIKMGNLRDNPIEEIWNNKKFRDFRKSLRKEKILPGCNRCVKL